MPMGAMTGMRETRIEAMVDCVLRDDYSGVFFEEAYKKNLLARQAIAQAIKRAREEGQGEVRSLAKENDRLRAMLANSQQACIYCDLAQTEWNKCEHGFPGCARADDAMLCPHVGACLKAEGELKRIQGIIEAFTESLKETVTAT